MDDAELRELYQRATSRRAGARLDCPSGDDVHHVLTGVATLAERHALADHLARCSDCAGEYRIAAQLEPWALSAGHRMPAAGVGQPTKPSLHPSFWRRALTIAAVAVLMAGGVTLWQELSPPPAQDRGPHSVTLSVTPADRAILPGPPDRLTWSTVADADAYQLVLYDFESTPLWESPRLTDPQVELPATIRSAMVPDRRYYWRIIVLASIDRRSSDLFQFTISVRR